jgi:hypothetical protein
MDVTDLMRQCNAKAPPSKFLVKGLARELNISESFLEKLAEEIPKDLGRNSRHGRCQACERDPDYPCGRFLLVEPLSNRALLPQAA